jgi:hypothetical protein
VTEADLAAIRKQDKRAAVARKKEMRRQVRLAILLGRTVPYSLGTLIDLGIGVAAIRKAYRNQD